MEWIAELAQVNENLDVQEIITLVNEERAVAGFPTVTSEEHVESELNGRRQHYRRAIIDALDRVDANTLVKIVTGIVDDATANGQIHAPVLIDDLVDGYELEAQTFLENEAENIHTLTSRIQGAADTGRDITEITVLVEALEAVVKNWDRVAQPIQLSTRSRGIKHEHSHDVAAEVRELAVTLFNEHDHLELSKRLTSLQQEVFAEVDQVVEKNEEDAEALDKIAGQRAQALRENEDWADDITFETQCGAVFKKRLRISPEGVEWQGRRTPLEGITRVRWGGTRHSVNGAPTGTTYEIFIGSPVTETKIEMNKQAAYSKFVDCLWKAVGVNILTDMLTGLSEGRHYRFGDAVISDAGVELQRHRLFRPDETVACGWWELVIGNEPGAFFIAKTDERRVSATLSYLQVDNVHVLETALRVLWKKPGNRLSGILSSD